MPAPNSNIRETKGEVPTPDFVIPKKPKAPEVSKNELEQAREAVKQEISEKSAQGEAPLENQPASPPPTSDIRPPKSDKSPALLAIESILEQDLKEAFTQMDPTTQMRFKKEGEKTAKKIESLMSQVKVKVKQIIDLIRTWLKTIPHANKFFIEQETKIKVDKIMALRK